MRVGGFVVLEFGTKTDMAIKVHLVTSDEEGGTVIRSKTADGDLSRSEALTILNRS
jgi:hypothetical protein